MPLVKGQKINRPSKPIADRFHTKYRVDMETGCWLWIAHIHRGGYAIIAAPGGRGEPLLAHRVSYEIHVGPIPTGLTIDHLCRVRHCVNPAHLETVTLAENCLRGNSVPAQNARKTHCKRGHPFDTVNTYWNPDGKGRRCRICMRADTQIWRARQATTV